MSERIQGKARVTVTLEVDLSDCWGSDCTVEQIHKQASDSVEYTLTKVFPGLAMQIGARLIGKPKVNAIITRPEDR